MTRLFCLEIIMLGECGLGSRKLQVTSVRQLHEHNSKIVDTHCDLLLALIRLQQQKERMYRQHATRDKLPKPEPRLSPLSDRPPIHPP